MNSVCSNRIKHLGDGRDDPHHGHPHQGPRQAAHTAVDSSDHEDTGYTSSCIHPVIHTEARLSSDHHCSVNFNHAEKIFRSRFRSRDIVWHHGK